jgi:hypothetical protein
MPGSSAAITGAIAPTRTTHVTTTARNRIRDHTPFDLSAICACEYGALPGVRHSITGALHDVECFNNINRSVTELTSHLLEATDGGTTGVTYAPLVLKHTRGCWGATQRTFKSPRLLCVFVRTLPCPHCRDTPSGIHWRNGKRRNE